jgi:DNA mismatch endonuclease (patch repair protein)
MKIRRTDHVNVKTRSAIMRAVKNRGVKSTELALRARLIAAGIRGWKMYADDIPGTPDFLFTAAKVAIYVDGCFWHGCPHCYRRPNSSQDYWDKKVESNRARDLRIHRKMRRAGWIVRRIWEHDVRQAGRALAIVTDTLQYARQRGAKKKKI